MAQDIDKAEQPEPIDNLELWKKLQRTDPKATKPFTKAGGFRGSQIDPAYRLQRMTEVFGPVGYGWGYEIFNRRTELYQDAPYIYVTARVWYVLPGETPSWPDGTRRDPPANAVWTGEQDGGTKAERSTDEIWKMSITDAIGKCMLQIGLAADIYLGMFDDSKYRDEFEKIYAVKNDPQFQPEVIAKFEVDLKDKLANVVDLEALDDLWRSGINNRIREIGSVDKAAQNRMIAAFSQRKNEIVNFDKGDGDQNVA